MPKTKPGLLPTDDTMKAQQLQWEHEEKTQWQEKLILAKAKAFALKGITIGGMAALCIAAFHAESAERLVDVAGYIVIGVVSFFGGTSRVFDKSGQHAHEETHN